MLHELGRRLTAAIKEVCETFGIEKFHEEQQKAIYLLFDGKDAFVSLPNGYGKCCDLRVEAPSNSNSRLLANFSAENKPVA